MLSASLPAAVRVAEYYFPDSSSAYCSLPCHGGEVHRSRSETLQQQQRRLRQETEIQLILIIILIILIIIITGTRFAYSDLEQSWIRLSAFQEPVADRRAHRFPSYCSPTDPVVPSRRRLRLRSVDLNICRTSRTLRIAASMTMMLIRLLIAHRGELLVHALQQHVNVAFLHLQHLGVVVALHAGQKIQPIRI